MKSPSLVFFSWRFISVIQWEIINVKNSLHLCFVGPMTVGVAPVLLGPAFSEPDKLDPWWGRKISAVFKFWCHSYKIVCLFETCRQQSLVVIDRRAILSWSFNSLWSKDVIWRHRSGSILVQVMSCCLVAPSHYLNQCWLILKGDMWPSPESNFTKSAHGINL